MGKTDKTIDDYIAKSKDFAKPILTHIRELVHAAVPEVEETLKWSCPHFVLKGTICSMAGFNEHCSIGFWKAGLMRDPHRLFMNPSEGMGHMRHLKSLADLPADEILIEYIQEAAELNRMGVKPAAKPKSTEKKELVVPEYFTAALKKNKKANETFESFNFSKKKDYVEWLTEAKTEATRDKRMATALEWLAEGKSRMWKYERK
jgi:uncharacterized protein YdeI (YjbR/CyaY-like superfamily)